MKPFLPALLIIVILFSSFGLKNNYQKVKDSFNIQAIEYNGTAYHLSWSAHPAANYYKQEYLPAGSKSETYTRMMMIEVVTGNISLKDAVAAKKNELEERKKTDALANYQIIENKATGEYILDFILSQSSGNTTAVVEWNTYRYVKLKDKNGKAGIQLFAYSKRAYGNAVTDFLKTLKAERPKTSVPLPRIKYLG